MPMDPAGNKMPDPSAVYQDWLDRGSACLMEGKADAFCEMIGLPFRMATIGGETIFETVDALRTDTMNVIESLQGNGVTHYIRLVKKARYVREDLIEGWHSTHVLRDAIEVVPSYRNRMILRRTGGEWRVTEAEHELSGTRTPVALLRSLPGAMAEQWEQPMSDIRASQARAEPLYAAFVDALSETVHTRDVDAWCSYFAEPHEAHFDDADHIVGADEERRFFASLCTKMDALKAKRFVRRVKFAEFVAADRIVGYHDTTMERDNEILFGPVRSRMVLTLKGGRWLCSSVTNSLSNKQFALNDFIVSETLPTLRDIEKRMKTR
ncbi:hypothetical protein [Gymnodinialimonas ulvae]|uniref:hypothetical protein n=1 Tax=Gymnodinialimonas ulvae TaxID=3126504 RepID=UPI00309BF355